MNFFKKFSSNLNFNNIKRVVKKEFIKNKWIYLSILLIIIIQASFLFNLKYLPSPLFGGDVYRERGFTEHIVQGYPFYEDPQVQGGVAFRPQFAYLFFGILSKIGFGSIDRLFIFGSLFLTLALLTAVYFLSKELTKSDMVAVGSMWIWIFFHFTNMKPTYSFGILFLILGTIFMIRTIKFNKTKDKILTGVALGLSMFSHLMFIIYLVVWFGFIIFGELLHYIYKKKSVKSYFKLLFERVSLPFIIMFGIILVYFIPIFIFGKNSLLNKVNEYAGTNVDLMGITYVAKAFANYFLNFTNLLQIIVSIIAILGLIYAFSKFNNERERFLIFLFIGSVLAAGHFLITKPLFNFWIIPSNIFGILEFTKLLFIILGLAVLITSLRKYKQYFIICLLVIVWFFLFTNIQSFKNSNKSNFEQNDFLNEMYTARSWILGNTNNYDIFLANDESAFAINVLTARKQVMLRRIHASQYVDMNKRYADGIVMLYGNNSVVVNDLISKYSVKYLYVDNMLLKNPMITDAKYASYLDSNGVKFTISSQRWDVTTIDAKIYPSVVVPPQNITLITRPDFKIVYQNKISMIAKI